MRSFATVWSPRSHALWQDFEDVFGNFEAAPVHTKIPSEINETEEHFLISLDLPGLRAEDIKISAANSELVIAGERKREQRAEKFERRFSLPPTVDSAAIEASYENGVLDLLLPKTAATKPRQIEIKSGKGGFLQKILGNKNETKDVSTSQ
jgi:HSP20 family protein